MSESAILARILLDIGATPYGRFFRNTVGFGWQGQAGPRSGTVRLEPGDVLVRNARAVTFGLCSGSPDIIGWRSMVVTPEMVGTTVAVFAAPEVKTPTGPARLLQTKFIDAVNAAGGLAGLVRSPEDARALLLMPRRE